jgi:hypothetical protein
MYHNANKLFRWKVICEEYKKHAERGLPDSQIFSRFIYPKFFISKRTFVNVLGTPIDKELKAMGFTQEQINAHVLKYNNTCETISQPMAASIISTNPYMKTNFNQIF